MGAGSHGSSFYGTGMDVSVTDPIGTLHGRREFRNFRGKGLLGLCGPDGIYGPYCPLPFRPPYLGPGR